MTGKLATASLTKYPEDQIRIERVPYRDETQVKTTSSAAKIAEFVRDIPRGSHIWQPSAKKWRQKATTVDTMSL